MSRWFRVYDDVLDDPKVQHLEPELFKVWVNLLCVASKCGDRLPPLKEIAFRLRLPETDVTRFMKHLNLAGLIDDGIDSNVIVLHNWKQRQALQQRSTERVRKWRENKRKERFKKSGNANETPMKHVKRKHVTMIETSIEREKEREIKKENNTKEKKSRRNGFTNDDPEFSAFYLAYPRHEGRGQARRAYQSARAKASAETLLTAAQHAAKLYAATEKRFIPMPATWLNGERWADQPSKNSGAEPRDWRETLR